MQGIPRTGYPDETIQVSPGDVQIIPRVRPQDVQVIPRGTSYPGGSYGSSLPPMPPRRVSGGGPRVSEPINTRPGTFMGSLHHPQRTGFRRHPNLPEVPVWNPTGHSNPGLRFDPRNPRRFNPLGYPRFPTSDIYFGGEAGNWYPHGSYEGGLLY